ncbi:MAG: MarR family transcriptional regulator [Ahrensia sp.]
MPETKIPALFELFNEIGIIAQLSRASFEARLPNGILLTHFSVLNHLVRVGDGPTPLNLSRAFQVPKTSMTHTLSGLEKAGFIVLRPHEKDGRSKRVFITDEGRAFRESAIGLLAPDMAMLASHLDMDALVGVIPHLRTLREYLDKARD